jgi:carbon monoxide dehydrogenase subunit G
MRIEERFDVAVPRSVVFAELNSVAEIGTCVAGVKQVTVIDDDRSRWTIEVSAGFMAMTMDFEARIVERREPAYLGFVATGQNVDLSGHVDVASVGTAVSRCVVVIDADPKGPLAPLVEQMGRGIQQQLARKTIGNIRERLEGAAVAPSPPTTHLAPPPTPAWPVAPRRLRRFAVAALLIGIGGCCGALLRRRAV